jgi:hypothetical protein
MTERVRVYTVSEANAALPRLNVIMERQMDVLKRIDETSEAMRQRGADPQYIEAAPTDAGEVAELKSRLRDLLGEFREGWREVEAMGAVVKDSRLGLIDFYGRRGGALVWLCWKYGEPAVSHWHALDQGFASRKPLERDSIPPTLN